MMLPAFIIYLKLIYFSIEHSTYTKNTQKQAPCPAGDDQHKTNQMLLLQTFNNIWLYYCFFGYLCFTCVIKILILCFLYLCAFFVLFFTQFTFLVCFCLFACISKERENEMAWGWVELENIKNLEERKAESEYNIKFFQQTISSLFC